MYIERSDMNFLVNIWNKLTFISIQRSIQVLIHSIEYMHLAENRKQKYIFNFSSLLRVNIPRAMDIKLKTKISRLRSFLHFHIFTCAI